MENKYKLTENVRGYLASAVLAGALTFGSYSAQAANLEKNQFGGYSVQKANLPINEQTKQSIIQVSENYRGLEQEVTDSFNQAISDGKFDLEEQKKIFESINGLRTYAEEHNIQASPGLKELYVGLGGNFYFPDLGKVGLQRTLENEGVKCYVEPCGKPERAIIKLGLGFLGLLGIIRVGRCFLGGRRND